MFTKEQIDKMTPQEAAIALKQYDAWAATQPKQPRGLGISGRGALAGGIAQIPTLFGQPAQTVKDQTVPLDPYTKIMLTESAKSQFVPKAQPKIMKVGRSIVQIDPNSGNVETLMEGQETEADILKTELLRDKQEKNAQKKEDAIKQHEASVEAIRDTAQKRLENIATVKKGVNYFGRFGNLSSQLAPSSILGGKGYDERKTWENATNTLLAQLGFDMMNEIKKASKTGATGLDAMSEKEGQWMRQASTELTRDISPQRALEILNELERIHKKVLSGDSGEAGASEIPSFATPEEAEASGYKGEAIIGGRRARID